MKRVLLGTVALLCLASCSYRVYPVDALVDNYKLAMTTPEEVAAKENVAVFLSEQEIPGPYKLIAFLENPAPASKDILKKAVMKADELGGNAVIIQSARSFKVIELTGRPVRKASVARTQPSPRPEPRVAPTPKQKEPRAKEGNVIDKVKGAPIFQKDEAKAEARAEARAAKAEAAKTRAIEAEAAKAKAAAERASKAEAEKAAKAEAEAAKAKAAAERASKAEAEKAAKAEAEAAKAKAAAEKAAKAEAEKAAKAEAEAAKAKAAADQQFAREQAARAKAEAEAEAARVRAEAEAAKAKAAAEKAAAEKATAEKAATAAAAKTGTTRKSPVFDDNTLQWFTSGYVYRVKEEEQAEIIDAMNYEIRENLKICKTQAEAEFIAGKIDQLEKFNNSQPIPSTALTSKIKGYKSLLKKLSSKFSGEQSAAAGAVQSVKDFFQNLGNK